MADDTERHFKIVEDLGKLKEGQRNLEKADEKHEDRFQRLESKIEGVTSAVGEKLESMRKEMSKMIADSMTSAAMNAAELAISRAKEDGILSPKSKALPVREFITERPITAVSVAAASPPILWQVFQLLLQYLQSGAAHP